MDRVSPLRNRAAELFSRVHAKVQVMDGWLFAIADKCPTAEGLMMRRNVGVRSRLQYAHDAQHINTAKEDIENPQKNI
jgi:hypothetical protein